MTGHNSHHYCYDVSYQCWFASEEAKIYCYNFSRSNAVVCSHLILAYTVRLALINEAGLERNDWFFFFIEECCVVIEKNIDKKLANRISYQIWHKRCLRGNFSRGGPNLRRGGSISPSGFGLGGPNPREVQFRCDTETTNYLKYYQLTSEILDYKLILFGSGHFDHNMEKNITVIGMF